MVVSRREEGIRYQPGEIRVRRWRPCSLIHGAAVTVAPYFAFHENVFVCLSSLECDAGALKCLSYACTRTCARARACTTCTRHIEHNINIRNALYVQPRFRVYMASIGFSANPTGSSAVVLYRASANPRDARANWLCTQIAVIFVIKVSLLLSLSLFLPFFLYFIHSRSEKNISAFLYVLRMLASTGLRFLCFSTKKLIDQCNIGNKKGSSTRR